MLIYVSAKTAPGGNGTSSRPFRTISEAASTASPGDQILVGPGIYREQVIPPIGGTEDKPIVYRSVSKGAAVITGSDRIRGWEPYEKKVYRLRIPGSYFGSYNPYTTLIGGDWHIPSEGGKIHTGGIFLNGKPLTEVSSLDQVRHPEKNTSAWDAAGTELTWYTRQDKGDTLLYANFGDCNPEEELTEVIVRRRCFFPEKTGCDHIVLSGFTVRHAATTWAPPTAFQDGMIGPNWSKGWVIEDCDISGSTCCGISLGKCYQPDQENKWSLKYVKDGTQTQREVVCQSVNEGWSKETVGSHVVRHCNIHHCGQAGIVGHMGCAFSLIEENNIHHINVDGNLCGYEIAGIKFHAAIDTVIRRNHIHHCTRGLWLDWEAQGTRVTANFFHGNTPPAGCDIPHPFQIGEDLFVEVSHGPTMIDHNLLLSDIGCRLSTQGIALVHNLIAGSFSYVGSGGENGGKRFPAPRYTPYHLPHSTKIAGFMTILHGDARFYNNIFIQKTVRPDLASYFKMIGEDKKDAANLQCGTFVYDGYPTHPQYMESLKPETRTDPTSDVYYDHLPVYTGGNLFFNGAKPWEKEAGYLVDSTHTISITLSEKGRHTLLHTNLYDYLPETSCIPITTEMLGKAFEPEMRFENPDGSELDLLTDYLGEKAGIKPLPGPFAADADGKILFTCDITRPEPMTEFGENGAASAETAGAADASVVGDANTSAEFGTGSTGFEDPGQGTAGSFDEAAPAWSDPTVSEKTESTADQDIHVVEAEETAPKKIRSILTLTGCSEVSFPFEDKLFLVDKMFVHGNIVWIRELNTDRLMELDLEYGIYYTHHNWEMSSMQALDVGTDQNAEGFARTVGTLLSILSKSISQNPDETCRSINEKVNQGLKNYGITMRMTPKYLKFIREKKFISFEDVIYRICQSPMELVTEVIRSH